MVMKGDLKRKTNYWNNQTIPFYFDMIISHRWFPLYWKECKIHHLFCLHCSFSAICVRQITPFQCLTAFYAVISQEMRYKYFLSTSVIFHRIIWIQIGLKFSNLSLTTKAIGFWLIVFLSFVWTGEKHKMYGSFMMRVGTFG